MSKEMGPRNVNLSLSQRVAAHSTSEIVGLLDALITPNSVRFNAQTATLSMSGHSKFSGDQFSRGQFVALLCCFNALLPLAPIMLLGELSHFVGKVGAWMLLVLIVALALFAVVNGFGSFLLMREIDVIDHTTEPLPEALTELQAAYVNGDIGQDDLERQVGEVMER